PVAWTNFSDSRIKNNVQENVVGLAFIKKLRPVTYNLDAKKLHDFTHPKSNAASNDSIQQPTPPQIDFAPSSAIVHSGFIAQEVEQAAQAVGYTNSIVSAPANSNDLYALSYAEFVVPLVKAVQELSSTVDSLKQALAACCCSGTTQRTLNNSMGATQQKNAAMPNTSADNGTQAILYQNNPNPFSQTTVVKCFVPPNTQSSSLLVFDMNGALKKTIPINNSGTINITINGGDLTPGMYYYTLLIDGQEVDTKKMILTQ
ncbi:MAG TPA: tail fiber domain-containing protein, partial [Bacteroidia bacterium]|nr:tail fiber domain-containing protein [Bacteroidia bacterium]